MTTTTGKRRRRGSIRPNGSGFQARVYAGLDPLSKKAIYLHEQASTLDEAEKARTRLLLQVDEERQPRSRITVGQAIEQWMAVARLEESTRERYECAIRLYLQPAVGDVQAANLHPQTVELFYARLERCRGQCEGRLRGRKDPETGRPHACVPLSNGYLRKLHYILRPALERAFRWGYLSRNPHDRSDDTAALRGLGGGGGPPRLGPGRLPGPADAPVPEHEPATWEKVTVELREAIEDGVMPPGSTFLVTV